MTDQATNPNDPGQQVGGGHYGGHTFQHWDWAEYNGMGAQEYQITRYVLRWRAKNGVEDLKKALHHTTKLIEQYATLFRRNRSFRKQENRSLELYKLMNTGPAEQAICNVALNWEFERDLIHLRGLILALIKEAS